MLGWTCYGVCHKGRDKSVASKSGILTGIAGRYAAALFELAQEVGGQDADQIAADVASVGQLLNASEDLQKLVRSPVISAAEQEAAMFAILDKLGANALTKNFIGVVIRKRRAYYLGEIIRQFAALNAAALNEMVAEVISAHPLSDAQVKEIADMLSQRFSKTVVVDAKTDETLLGGLVVKAGSRMVDGSLKTKLNSLKLAMNEAG